MKQSDLKARIAELESQLAAAVSKARAFEESWKDAMKANSQDIAGKMELGKLEKLLLVVNLITAGKTNEAIQELLKPLPMIFKMDIRFADDKSRIAAAEEQLEQLKELMIANVRTARLAKSES